YRDFTTVDLQVVASLTDLRSEELTRTDSFSVEGVGIGLQAALDDAARNAGASLAAMYQDTWSTEYAGKATIAFVNVHRPSTRFEIEEVLEATPGVTPTTALIWDASSASAVVQATFFGD